MTIHTFGDSHSLFGWEGVSTHHLGPILCYSFGKDKLSRCDLRNFNIKDGDSVVFCFGEIDCRCHIHKHVNETTTYQYIIDAIVNNYFEAIALNISLSPVKLKKVVVYNVVPPVQKHNTIESPEYPYLGEDEQRKEYTLYFNKKLKEQCKEREYVFFDIYDKYTDVNGYLSKLLGDGTVHIKHSHHMEHAIKDYDL